MRVRGGPNDGCVLRPASVNTSSPSRISLMADRQIRNKRVAEVDAKEDRAVKRLRRPTSGRHSSNFSPYFWKSLSIVNLTSRALRELDRQNHTKLQSRFSSPEELFSGSLARFARQGGPDLQYLRHVCLIFAETYRLHRIFFSRPKVRTATRQWRKGRHATMEPTAPRPCMRFRHINKLSLPTMEKHIRSAIRIMPALVLFSSMRSTLAHQRTLEIVARII